MIFFCFTAFSISVGLPASIALAGPFVDAGHPPSGMSDWATSVDEVVRGPIDISNPGGAVATLGDGALALGAATATVGDVVSLGDGGSATLVFDSGIGNGPGDDFAVFENGFLDLFGLFAELAYVEVSSNGVDFARFDSDAFNPVPIASFDTLDPTDYHGFAGRHEIGLGTGFDLADLETHPSSVSGDLNLYDVRYVRVIDVIGDGSTVDGGGNPIFDPYSTPFSSGGFDLEAIGVIHVPEASLANGLVMGLLALALGFRPTSRRLMSRRRLGLATVVAVSIASTSSAATMLTATFEDLGLGVESFEDGSAENGGFTSGGIFFSNTFTDFGGGCCSSGYAASTLTDTTTPGPSNQYSNITGSGAGGSDGYGIAFSTGSIILPEQTRIISAEITNTTYAALSMLNGDPFSKKFGGNLGNDPDYFRLIFEGFNVLGNSTGSVEIMLADFRFADSADDFILDTWVTLDLSGLGAVKEIQFSFESSDVGEYGINTPQYFAIDNLMTIPEPGTAILLGLGLLTLARRSESPRAPLG